MNIVEEHDRILQGLDRWKQRVIAAFLLLSLLTGITAVLLFEIAGVLNVWQLEFGSNTARIVVQAIPVVRESGYSYANEAQSAGLSEEFCPNAKPAE